MDDCFQRQSDVYGGDGELAIAELDQVGLWSHVQAVLATGETHGIQMQLTQIIEWMALDQ